MSCLKQFTRLLRGQNRWTILLHSSVSNNNKNTTILRRRERQRFSLLVYLDNVTWYGDCKCNLIVNYSVEKIEMPDRLPKSLNAQLIRWFELNRVYIMIQIIECSRVIHHLNNVIFLYKRNSKLRVFYDEKS
jgi:hypothetical protein